MSVSFPKDLMGCRINQERWNHIKNILNANTVDNNTFDINKLHEFHQNNSSNSCGWIPKGLLLLNVVRYFNNKELIILKIKETGKIKDQLDFYSLLMDNDYLNNPKVLSRICFKEQGENKKTNAHFVLSNNSNTEIELVPKKYTSRFNVTWSFLSGFVFCVGSNFYSISKLGDGLFDEQSFPSNELKRLKEINRKAKANKRKEVITLDDEEKETKRVKNATTTESSSVETN